MTPPTAHHTVALCAPDEELIEAHLGANASARRASQRLVRLGAPAAKLDATRAVLARDLAAAMRAMASITHGSKLDNITAIRLGLELKASRSRRPTRRRRCSSGSSRGSRRSASSSTRAGRSASLALEDLQSAAAERMLTSSGNRLELLDRLHHFQIACDRMVRAACRSTRTHARRDGGATSSLRPAAPILSLSARTAPKIKSPVILTRPPSPSPSPYLPITQVDLIPGFACTLGRIEDALSARGLSKSNKEELMARLTESVDAGKAAAAAAGDMCDLVTQGPICVEGGKKVITADAAPKSLLAHFTFDDSHGLDTSGSHNHAVHAPSFGPGVGGHGHAARFVGTDYTEIRHQSSYAESGSAFTIEMWLYLRQDSTGDWRTVVHKGGRDEEDAYPLPRAAYPRVGVLCIHYRCQPANGGEIGQTPSSRCTDGHMSPPSRRAIRYASTSTASSTART